ncbi:phage antirepressor KilAC domain-containing protein [Orbus wheelerorum]|uniref:phage antirepressor KilAC domain-containing protein n=1 Tax=Orbus wheelerorum TaxID=3074111 RepID=UPI00370D247C
MSNLTNISKLSNNELTMSSRDLLDVINEVRKAEGENPVRVNQFHDRVADELSDFNYKTFVVENLNNTQSTYFELNQDMCMLVAMRESKRVRRVVLDQLKNKFNQNQLQVPQTLPEALRLAAQAIEENIQLNEKILLDAPKVSFVDNFVDVGTTKSLRETAKILKMSERAMIDSLEEDRILFRQSGNLLPYANHINNGYFEVKTGERNGHAYTQTRVSTKGMAYIAKRYASELMVV